MLTKTSLFSLVHELRENGLDVVIFGGWSVELQNFKKPWRHGDIDLLLVGNSFRPLIKLVNEKGWEIRKSYSHKKAFLIDGVLVEVFLVIPDEKRFITRFLGSKGSYDFVWPESPFAEKEVDGVNYQLASKASMDKYSDEHQTIHSLGPWR